jgi:hypothetical protein
VKDDRAAATSGWVYGTFNYNAAAPGTTPWERMVPIGLMWGNDPSLTPERYRTGRRPTQTRIIAGNVMANTATDWNGLGWLERLNGPIDNPSSACLSCHMTAQRRSSSPMYSSALSWATVKDPSEALPPATVATKMRWFRNLRRQPFDAGGTSLDYSLQLQDGLDAWCAAEGCGSR